MNKIKYIILVGLWCAYLMVSFSYFPVYNVNIGIPALALIALTTWLLGVRSSMLIILLLYLPYHFLLLDYYAEILVIFQAKAFGTCTPIIIVFLIGTLKQQRDHLQNLSVLLDQKVSDRTMELNQLIEQLINDDERLRRRLGQDIHDGLGQNLTGLLLYSSSLQNELNKSHSNHAEKMEEIMWHAEKNLNLARKVSRTLFPFKMIETGFEAALDELTSYFKETTSVEFEIYLDGSEQRLPEQTIIHLYRIAYESILNSIHNDTPSKIKIKLASGNEHHTLITEIDGCDEPEHLCNNMSVELMRYRAKLLHGRLTTQVTPANKIIIQCNAPSIMAKRTNTKTATAHA